MPSLKDSIAKLAESFADEILAAVRTMSLDDLVSFAASGAARGRAAASPRAERSASAKPRRAGGGKRRRRSKDDIEALGTQIVELLRKNPSGLRAEQIKAALGVPRNELPRALHAIVDAGSARREGEKRATTYFAVGEGAGSSSGGASGEAAAQSKRGGKRAGKRGGKRAGARATKKRANKRPARAKKRG